MRTCGGNSAGRSATKSATRPTKEVAIVSNYFFDTEGRGGTLVGSIELCSRESCGQGLEGGVVVCFV